MSNHAALIACYDYLTEKFDLSVCTGPIGMDGIRPANARERNLIGLHARKVYRVVAEMTCGDFLRPNAHYDRMDDLERLRTQAESTGLLEEIMLHLDAIGV